MADVETDNEGDTNPHPFNVTANPTTNPASQSNTANVPQSQNDPIPSLNNPIRFTNVEDDNSENDDKKPPH
jgi:hypothetical protein